MKDNLIGPNKKLSVKHKLLAIDPVVAFSKILLPAIEGKPKWLDNGREIKKIKLRPRELLGLIILSHVERKRTGLIWDIATDHSYGDGTVVLGRGKLKGHAIPVEQVYIPRQNSKAKSLADSVLDEVNRKENKGKDYADDRSLLVFVNSAGTMDIQKVFTKTSNTKFLAIVLIGIIKSKDFHFYVGFKNIRKQTEEYEVIICKKCGKALVNRGRSNNYN